MGLCLHKQANNDKDQIADPTSPMPWLFAPVFQNANTTLGTEVECIENIVLYFSTSRGIMFI